MKNMDVPLIFKTVYGIAHPPLSHFVKLMDSTSRGTEAIVLSYSDAAKLDNQLILRVQ